MYSRNPLILRVLYQQPCGQLGGGAGKPPCNTGVTSFFGVVFEVVVAPARTPATIKVPSRNVIVFFILFLLKGTEGPHLTVIICRDFQD